MPTWHLACHYKLWAKLKFLFVTSDESFMAWSYLVFSFRNVSINNKTTEVYLADYTKINCSRKFLNTFQKLLLTIDAIRLRKTLISCPSHWSWKAESIPYPTCGANQTKVTLSIIQNQSVSQTRLWNYRKSWWIFHVFFCKLINSLTQITKVGKALFKTGFSLIFLKKSFVCIHRYLSIYNNPFNKSNYKDLHLKGQMTEKRKSSHISFFL